MALAELGEFERAAILADHSMSLAREIENPFVKAAVVHFRGCARCARGECPGAAQDLAEARRIAQPLGDLFRIFAATCWGGRAEVMMGHFTRARSMLEEALALAERLGTRYLVRGRSHS